MQNSGGPGRSRGGAALQRGYRLLADEAILVMRSDRRDHLPYGLYGGLPGTPSWNVLNPGPNQRLLPACPMSSVPMVRDDVFLHIQAGAGGHGDPLDRDPGRILDDVLNELITPVYASDVYGVVIVEGEIDIPATDAKRMALRKKAPSGSIHLAHFHATIGIPATRR